ncbi:MAG: hypothetical protein ACRDGE_07370, partial [Candidatus Limnocylindria bacterium]
MNEEELRRRLDAELGRVPVRPYAEYRGRSRERRSVAPFGAAALVTVLLVGAVGAGQLLRSAREAPASSPSPSIGASPSPALAQDGYGVAVVDLRGLTVYRESDGAAVARHPARFPAISPDGARFAYADEGRVYLAPVGRPEAASLLLDVGPEVVSRVVWAIDGTGLLIGVRSAEALPGPGATPRYSGLRTVEIHRTMLSSSGVATYGVRVTERLRLEERSLEPLLWDRSRDLVAGLEHFGQKGVG